MNNKKLRRITAILVIGVILYFVISWVKPLYGNDEASIVKVIRSLEGYQDPTANIEIVEIKDIKEHRVVSFLYDKSPAYAHFLKNTRGNYRWTHVEKRSDESLANFIVHPLSDKVVPPVILFVANEDNEVAKIHVYVNGEVIETELLPHTMDVAWVEIPGTKEKSYQFDYVYYDEEGKRIETHQ